MRRAFVGLLVAALAAGVAASAQAASAQRGQQFYQMHCAACHGFRGEGVAAGAPKFQLGERLNQPDVLLMQSVKTGKKNMPPFFGVLRDTDILDVLAYVRTLR